MFIDLSGVTSESFSSIHIWLLQKLCVRDLHMQLRLHGMAQNGLIYHVNADNPEIPYFH